jgi:hypothetical protein
MDQLTVDNKVVLASLGGKREMRNIGNEGEHGALGVR